jgi:hypothetical protein
VRESSRVKKVPVTRAVSPLQRFSIRAGRPRIVADPLSGLNTPARWFVAFVTFRPEFPPVPIGLRPTSTRLIRTLGCHRRTHSPVIRARFAATSPRNSPALRRLIRPATASPHRINRPVEGTTGRDPFRFTLHVRPDPARFDACTQSVTSRRLADWSGASLEVFVPFSVHWLRSRPHAWELPTPRRSRFVVPSCRPALLRSHGPADITPTLRVFASGPYPGPRTCRDEARVAGLRAERWKPNSSLTFLLSRLSRFDALPGMRQDMAATRRPCCSRRRTPSATALRKCVR